MKRFFKAVTAILFVFCIVALGFVVYGETVLPEEITVTSGDKVQIGAFFSVDESGAKPAFSSEEHNEFKSRITALKVFPVKDITVNVTKRRYVAPGGEAFGIKLYTKGIIVVSVDSVITSSGAKEPAIKAGLECGDVITHINGKAALNSAQLTDAVEQSGGKELKLTVEREGVAKNIALKPELSVNGGYKAGIWVRDSSAGIGTVTFYDDVKEMFAGLGHGVCDVDTGKIMPLDNGEAVKAEINGFYKSSAGNPGELCGVFSDVVLGNLCLNHDKGVYGRLLQPSGKKAIPVALETEVHTGKAQIITTVDESGPQYYDIEIVKIYPSTDASGRNMVIKITDEKLLEKTGGIVQGMSGSPIIQDSMLAGAVTHVFISDPVQGYAIFAQRMLETMDENCFDELTRAS